VKSDVKVLGWQSEEVLQSVNVRCLIDEMNSPFYQNWQLLSMWYERGPGWLGRGWIYFARLKKPTAVGLEVWAGAISEPPPQPGEKFMIPITDVEKVNLHIGAVDAKGNPTAFPSGVVPTWIVDKPTVIALTPSADGTSCFAQAVGPEDTARVNAQADFGAGTVTSPGFDIQVTGSAPTGLGTITNDPPVPA
jgi:hypothetical protein